MSAQAVCRFFQMTVRPALSTSPSWRVASCHQVDDECGGTVTKNLLRPILPLKLAVHRVWTKSGMWERLTSGQRREIIVGSLSRPALVRRP
jgi:hypothetical protein